MNIEDCFVILCPSRDGKLYADTAYLLIETAHSLKKTPVMICTDGLTYWAARNNVVKKLKATLDNYAIKYTNNIRTLWIDSDILIEDSIVRIVNLIRNADVMGLNLIANYKNTWGRGKVANTIMLPNEDGTYRTVSDEELTQLKTIQLGGMPTAAPSYKDFVGGLGFYYGSMNLDYEFKIYPPYETEDIPFYRDNKLELTYTDLKLWHNKNIFL